MDSLKEQVEELKRRANNDETYTNRCINCKEKVVWVEADHGVAPGHIYSAAGRDEYGISRCCEYCFDELFKEDEEDV